MLGFTDELARDSEVHDATWSTFSATFDDCQAVEIALTVSWYCCAARLASGLGIPLEANHAGIPPVR